MARYFAECLIDVAIGSMLLGLTLHLLGVQV